MEVSQKGDPGARKAWQASPLGEARVARMSIRLVMLAVPSRSDVPQYQKLKRETDELVGRVNHVLRVVKENGFTSYANDIEIVE